MEAEAAKAGSADHPWTNKSRCSESEDPLGKPVPTPSPWTEGSSLVTGGAGVTDNNTMGSVTHLFHLLSLHHGSHPCSLGWQGMRRNRCSLRVTLRHQTQFLCGKGPSHLPWACSALAWIQPCRFSLVAAKSCSAQALGDAPCLPCSTLLPWVCVSGMSPRCPLSCDLPHVYLLPSLAYS